MDSLADRSVHNYSRYMTANHVAAAGMATECASQDGGQVRSVLSHKQQSILGNVFVSTYHQSQICMAL